jgi:ABC-type branched-subunit amino acid transport system ATPase component
MAGPPILETRGVTMRFGGLTAVDDVSFAAHAQVITALIGPNGAGKSTVLNLLSGVYAPTAGEIWITGKKVNGRQPHKISGLGVARTFQTVQLFGNMTVVENVMMGLHAKGRAGILQGAFRTPGALREERRMFDKSIEYLAEVGLQDRAFDVATTLPYGQQRLLEIARAMACEPKVLLLDEPAAGLSSRETEDLAEFIRKIRDSGVGVLVVDHDMRMIMDMSDHVVVLDHGRKIAEGAPREVQADASVIAAYLGEEE